jgi:hypothetical protein
MKWGDRAWYEDHHMRIRTRLERLVLVLIAADLVVLVSVSVTGVRYFNRSDAKESKAQLGCMVLATAIEAYVASPENPKREFPRSLPDLLQPPFGGPSFLRNGHADLMDPWGMPYRFERVRRRDGTEYLLVTTTAPDGTPMSQHGVGKNAAPRLD